MARLLLLLAIVSTASCVPSYIGSARDFDGRHLKWIGLPDVPEIRQESVEDCGVAAMAMVLAFWKDPVAVEEIRRDCPPEPGRGIKAGELKKYALGRGLEAHLFPGTLDDLEDLMRKARPPIVGMVKPHLQGKLLHYEVVVGWNPALREVATLDPARGYRTAPVEGFLQEWKESGNLVLLVARPEKK